MVDDGVAPDRDVAAYDRRADTYENGRHGDMHRAISDRVVSLTASVHPDARRVLDVGSGTGYVLRGLASRLPRAEELVGIDAAPRMVAVARSSSDDTRVRFDAGLAERLPYPDERFDLVVSTTSFDHWTDQGLGLRECARVLAPGGHLVLTDQFAILPWPTLLVGRRRKVRTRRGASRLIAAAGLGPPEWRRLYAVVISTAVASK